MLVFSKKDIDSLNSLAGIFVDGDFIGEIMEAVVYF